MQKRLKTIKCKKRYRHLKRYFRERQASKSRNTVDKIRSNTDYAEAIFMSKLKHNIPYDNITFSMLPYIQQRNVIVMLIEAIETTIIKFSLVDSKKEN